MVGRLSDTLARMAHEPGPKNLGPEKLRAIDVACTRLGVQSLADLGAIWAVDGGYSSYAHDRYGLEKIIIVDDDISSTVRKRYERSDSARLIEGNFGTEAVRDQVGKVDAVILFDVLLHQVSPDWNEILSMYAANTQTFILSGPWHNGTSTIRLTDLTREKYMGMVPADDIRDYAWDHLDEINPARGQVWRDVHDIWQWAITDGDLRSCLHGLGFSLKYFENLGAWRGLHSFGNYSYVFSRQSR
jgi:hypothetical protein